ncbi:MAG TPA: HlyC/CorC family transporter [Phycisphaerales bacterium]|nr:HlyC/CorC family transporter [Phycisphaerales bacterium]
MATFLLHSIWQLSAMTALLLASGFCSGSETAFFHLSRRQVRRFADSPAPLERLAASLLSNPNRFLTALLFANMTVNVLYFATSSMLSIQAGRTGGVAAGAAAAFVSFLALLLGGEMLPKSLAYANTRQFCLFASPACYVLLRALSPLLAVLDYVVVQPAVRLLVHPAARSSPVTAEQLRMLLDKTRRKGWIGDDENLLLAEILKFGFLKVRHIMQPRVEMPACSIALTSAQFQAIMYQHQLVKIPVYKQYIDAVAGVVYLRDLLLNPDQEPAQLVRPVVYVPEQKSVESLIEFFRTSGENMAIVVDEYGGIAGWVHFEHIIEQLLQPMDDGGKERPIEQIGPLSYRLEADLSIYDWKDAFGIDLEETHLTTVGGFVTALLGRIPRPGDKARLKNLKFTVESVRNNRIHTVVLTLEPILDNTLLQTDNGARP